MPAGRHQYKFVVDGQWQADPLNPTRSSDGFGGENSVLELQCNSSGDLGVAAGFPLESRPRPYGYDNNAPAGLVSATHADAYFEAAHTLVASAVAAPGFIPCDPAADARGCADRFVRDFGRRAFRRPLSDAERSRYVTRLLAAPVFQDGVRLVAETMLSSPLFLYRSELGAMQPDGRWRLTDYEVASALSYSLWSTLPDEPLLAAADRGELHTPEQVQQQARRLLTDDRARPVLRRFAMQWLGVEQVLTADKSPELFKDFTPELRGAMAAETQRLFEHVVLDGSHRFEELLTSDVGYLDPALARFYGVTPGSTGDTKVQLPAPRRAGLLGQGSVLASYAHSDQTSPIRRGLFVRQVLLCQELGTPPANAARIPHVDATATTRERFRQHSADPACSSCHRLIDEVGFGMEQFDAAGAFRETENGKPIDAKGDLTDVERLGSGTHAPFSTLPELAQALAQSRQVKTCFAQQVFRYTRGRLELGGSLRDAGARRRLLRRGVRRPRAAHPEPGDGELPLPL